MARPVRSSARSIHDDPYRNINQELLDQYMKKGDGDGANRFVSKTQKEQEVFPDPSNRLPPTKSF